MFQQLAYALPGFERKTFAPSPVWRNSVREPVRWQPMPKREAIRLYHRAEDFERRTRQPGRQDGALGRNGLAVLRAFVFRFLNYASGRLDPAIATIARQANICPRSAARGLAKLKAAGVLHWLRRCSGGMEDGRYTLRQETNAYAILPAALWQGYDPPPDPPPPEAGTWGDHPPLPDALEVAIQTRQQGGSVAAMADELARAPDSHDLAPALLALWRAMKEREAREAGNGGFPGLPACP